MQPQDKSSKTQRDATFKKPIFKSEFEPVSYRMTPYYVCGVIFL